MATRTSHIPDGKELLRFVENCASALHNFRGFEMLVMRILLHLEQMPNGELCVERGELNFDSGVPKSTSQRLLKIMHDEDLVFSHSHENCRVTLALKTEGRKLVEELQSAYLQPKLQA